MDPATFAALVQAHYTTALGLSAGLFTLTGLGLALSREDRKRQIAWWLMGRQNEVTWSRSFVAIFDAVFGARHLSLRCIMTSVIASLAAVLLLWVLTGTGAGVQARLEATQSFGTVLAIGLGVNALADYLSLLETRWLLGLMHQIRHWAAQAGVLLIDLAVSAAIIWAALWAFQLTPLYARFTGGDGEDLGEVLLLFSPFAVFFYSTFITSVWVWLYILSTWVMRALARLRLQRLWNVEKHPVKILAATLAAAVLVTSFALSLGVGLLTAKDAAGLTVVDRAVCAMTRDRGCLAAATLTNDTTAKLRLLAPIIAVCDGVFTEECVGDRLARQGITTIEAAEIFRTACDSNLMYYCTNLAGMHVLGILSGADPAEAAELLSKACDAHYARGCTNLGGLHLEGISMDRDPAEAARLFAMGCDGGNPPGCTNLGVLHERGISMNPDPAEAARLFAMGCDGGDAVGCTNLGVLHERGIGMDPDPAEAARLFAMGCDGGAPSGCTNLGILHQHGIGMDPDLAEAARLYAIGCDGGDAVGCTNLGYLHERGIGMDPDPAEAARLYAMGCDGGNAVGCTNLGVLNERGIGIDPDPAEAARLFDRACKLGDADGCDRAADLAAE